MKTINVVLIDDVLTPADPLPIEAIKIIFDGEQYVVYEVGDDLLDE